MSPYYYFVVDATAPWVARTRLGQLLLRKWAEGDHEHDWYYWVVCYPDSNRNISVATENAARARIFRHL